MPEACKKNWVLHHDKFYTPTISCILLAERTTINLIEILPEADHTWLWLLWQRPAIANLSKLSVCLGMTCLRDANLMISLVFADDPLLSILYATSGKTIFFLWPKWTNITHIVRSFQPKTMGLLFQSSSIIVEVSGATIYCHFYFPLILCSVEPSAFSYETSATVFRPKYLTNMPHERW